MLEASTLQPLGGFPAAADGAAANLWTPSCTAHLRDAKAFAGHQIERDSAADLACGLL